MKPLRFLQIFFSACLLVLPSTAFISAQNSSPVKAASSDCQPANAAARPSTPQVFFGEPKKLGNGSIRSWVKLDDACKPAAIGLSFTETALSGLPMEPPAGEHGFEYNLDFPAQASATPFKHIGVNWNPKGHEPDNVYTVGHFDFHFYTITEAERDAITAQGEDLLRCQKPPAPEYVPQDYFQAPGSEVPRMGSHWIYKNAHELHGHAFTSTFLYGSYNGQIIFLEPMITKAFLETKPNLTEAIKQPAKVQKPGYYPTHYSVKYDAQNREYHVAFEGLTLR